MKESNTINELFRGLNAGLILSIKVAVGLFLLLGFISFVTTGGFS